MSARFILSSVWRAGLWAVLALLILVPSWSVALWVIQPDFITNPELHMTAKILSWLGLPVLGALAIAWPFGAPRASAAETAPRGQVPQAETGAASGQPRRVEVLEVVGLGVSLDKHRQGRLWDALKQGHAVATIREQDPKKYPWARQDKFGQSGDGAASALENGISLLPMYWPAPSFHADGPSQDPEQPISEINPSEGLVGGTDTNGLTWTLFVSAGWELSEHPDRLLEKAFDFFDQHPDVPYLVVAAADGLYFRDLYRPKGTPQLIRDGHYVPEMPNSAVLFVLARRERVEALRPFAFEDTSEDALGPEQNRKGIARRLFLAHYDLSRRVPRPQGALSRNPTVPEWLAESARLSQLEAFRPAQGVALWAHRLGELAGGVVHVPAGFKPTPWFPVPWNRKQLSDFDRLPTLGYVHRPVYIALTDAQGRRLQRADERLKALQRGWQQALQGLQGQQGLPEAQRQASPARIVVSTGGDAGQRVALASLMQAQADAGGPELDAGRPEQWVDTDARLGNTGAATWFMQTGIGVLASHLDGGVSAAINLRDEREASVVFISPPPEALRQRQNRMSVLKNRSTPAIDPANYR